MVSFWFRQKVRNCCLKNTSKWTIRLEMYYRNRDETEK